MSWIRRLFSDDPKKTENPKAKEAEQKKPEYELRTTSGGTTIRVYPDGRVVWPHHEQVGREVAAYDRALRQINIDRARMGLDPFATLEEAVKDLYKVPKEYTNY